MSEFIKKQVVERRNKLLMVWIADNLDMEEIKRQKFYKEIRIVLKHITDGELAEYLFEKLHHKNLVNNLESAKKTIKHFHGLAYDQFSNASSNQA